MLIPLPDYVVEEQVIDPFLIRDDQLVTPPLTKEFLQKTKAGIVVPVTLATVPGISYLVVVDGRNRIKAARVHKLWEIPARVYKNVPLATVHLWSQLLNSQRRDNVLTTLDVVSSLLQQGVDNPSQIARKLGMKVSTTRNFIRVANTIPSSLLDAIPTGKVSFGAILELSKLGSDEIKQAVNIFNTKKKLTLEAVKKLRSSQIHQRLAAMPTLPTLNIPKKSARDVLVTVVEMLPKTTKEEVILFITKYLEE